MILLSLALAAGLGTLAPAPADTTRTIFGQWQYNKSRSDPPNAYVGRAGMTGTGGYAPGAMGGAGGGYGGGGTGGYGTGSQGMGHRGGPPPVGPRDPSAAEKAAHAELVFLALRAPARLQLSEAEGVLTVVSDSGAPISLKTDGHKVRWFTPDSVRVETHAKWEAGRLVVTHDVHNAGKVTYTFYLSPDGVELFVAVAVYPKGGPTRPIPYRQVYDPIG